MLAVKPLIAVTRLDTGTLLEAWKLFKQRLGVFSIRNSRDYAKAQALMDELLDQIGENETHPLIDILDLVSDRISTYERLHHEEPSGEPRVVLRFLMDQHGLKQDQLRDCASQSRISEILAVERAVSKALAKKLAHRFGVRAD